MDFFSEYLIGKQGQSIMEMSTTEDSKQKQDKLDIIKILLADDHPLLRFALKEILEKQVDFKVIGEASDGEEAIKLATRLLPDIVIMDIDMPKWTALRLPDR